MDTRYLTYILAIARKKNMTKAAEELFVSQSSLSQYLSKLEQEIGTPLFFRTKGELTLTPAGQLYVDAAQKVIRIKEQLYKDIAALENRGHITIGVTSQFGLRVLTEIIPRFKSVYPDYRVEITEQGLPSITRMLLEENLDLGLMAANSTDPFPEDTVDLLQNEEVLFAIPASHPYAKENPSGRISRKDLMNIFKNENFLLSRKESTLRVLSDSMFASCHFEPSAMCETNSVTATRRMVASGIGVTFIGKTCVSSSDPVAYYSLEPPLFRLNLLVRRKNWMLNPAEEYLCQLIRSCFPPAEDNARKSP